MHDPLSRRISWFTLFALLWESLLPSFELLLLIGAYPPNGLYPYSPNEYLCYITETCLDHEAARESVVGSKIFFYRTCLLHFLGSVHAIFVIAVEAQCIGDVKRVYTPFEAYLLHPLSYITTGWYKSRFISVITWHGSIWSNWTHFG